MKPEEVHQLSQVSVSYVAEEDRIVLRLGFGHREAAFWLTRRFLKTVWPVLGQGLTFDPPAAVAQTPQVQREIHQIQEEAALQQSDFATAYDTTREPVWSGGPVLATEFSLVPGPLALPVLAMRNAAGVGLELVMDAILHAGLTRLLAQAVLTSGWDLVVTSTEPARPVTSLALH